MNEKIHRYVCNPDVVLREEDEEGGLLFNPDTQGVKVVNPTGLFIWKQFASATDLAAVATAIQQEFEDVPSDQVMKDLQEFVNEILAAGFLGTVVTPSAEN